MISAVFKEEYNADVTQPFNFYYFAENNTGYMTYDARMCQRNLNRSQPY